MFCDRESCKLTLVLLQVGSLQCFSNCGTSKARSILATLVVCILKNKSYPNSIVQFISACLLWTLAIN